MTPLNWTKDLDTAPRKTPDGYVLLVVLGDSGVPEPIRWKDYSEAEKEAAEADGYWDYLQDNISEVTGGISPDEHHGALWAQISLPQ
jgi:hypothetical protein